MSILDSIDNRDRLDRLWAVLPEARLVGGSVRDLLLGTQDVHDFDLATPEPPERVQELLEANGIRTVPIGLAHGTVTAVIEGCPFEITTLRRDVRTDGRHAEVAWTTSWEEDAARRDFTINALFCDREGLIHDYFCGRMDLEARRVRFVGEARTRIEEDALRILRFFRFDARFGTDTPDAMAMEAIAGHAVLVDSLSAERLAGEMLRLLIGPHVIRTLSHMQICGVLKRIVPGLRLERLAVALDAGVPADGILRLGLLSDAEGLGSRLKLSVRQSRRLERSRIQPAGIDPQSSDDALRRMLADCTMEELVDAAWHLQSEGAAGNWATFRTRCAAMERPVFPLYGRDAVRAGLEPGPEIGLVLNAVRGWWREGGCRADREACEEELRRMLPLSVQSRDR